MKRYKHRKIIKEEPEDNREYYLTYRIGKGHKKRYIRVVDDSIEHALEQGIEDLKKKVKRPFEVDEIGRAYMREKMSERIMHENIHYGPT